MKRFFTFLIIAALTLGVSQPLLAQGKDYWSIKGGVGWVSVPDFVGALVASLGSIDNTEGITRHEFAPLRNPNIEVLFNANDWFSIGASCLVGYSSTRTVFDDTGAVSKSASAFYPSVILTADTRYISKGRFTVYGSWGIGAMAMWITQRSMDGSTNNDNFTASVMGNVYPLCFSYKPGNSVSGYLELGWGAKGIVNVGIKF